MLNVQLRVLGPVEVQTADGQILTLPRRQERCLLGILLLEAGRSVPLPRLADLLWDDNPPAKAHQAIRTYVARIRSVLTQAHAADHGVTLLADRGGYRLNADPETVDVLRFRRLIARVEGSDPAEREAVLTAALALWRGPVLQHAATDHLYRRLCADITEQRLWAQEELLATGLARGRHTELLPELARLSADEPFRERFSELHMLALYHQGRTAEALDVYRYARKRLVDNLGLEPGIALQRLHQIILRGRPVPTDPASPVPGRAVPAQLPADLTVFVGRRSSLDQLDAVLTGKARTAVISTIAGTAGVGKTTLAVHWAHLIRDRFPDGQLYLNLRSYDHARDPMQPMEAIARFLDALAVPAARIPIDLDAQAALYRSLLADRRMLVVLDNARDPEQVRPLLPGSASCLVLVTSRSLLTGLVATEGAHPIILDLLSLDEARDLLARRLGPERIAAEPDAVEEIVSRCARLPLALAIVAARAATRPDQPLAMLAAELSDAHEQLNAFATADPMTDVRTVFSWSYRALTPAAAELFRLLGLHPGPDVSTAAAASLAGVPIANVQPILGELTRAHLIIEAVPGRYTFHDLLRAYATELAHDRDSDHQREDAAQRILDHYVHSAYNAERVLNPAPDPIRLTPLHPGVVAENPADHQAALDWFDAEHRVLLASVDYAVRARRDLYTWQLAWTLATFLYRRGYWHEQAATQRHAVDAAQRLADPRELARVLVYLARAYVKLRRHSDAEAHLRQALDLFRECGDLSWQAQTSHFLAYSSETQGHYREALGHEEHALALCAAAGDRFGQAYALNSIGWFHAQLDDHGPALEYCQQALSIMQDIDERPGEANTYDSLGYIHHHLGQYQIARDHYQSAVDIYRYLGDRYEESQTLNRLGDTYLAVGDREAARDVWQQALTILNSLDHPDADMTLGKLRDLEHPAGPAVPGWRQPRHP